MPDLVTIKRVLVSVSDKSSLAPFAAALVREFDVQFGLDRRHRQVPS